MEWMELSRPDRSYLEYSQVIHFLGKTKKEQYPSKKHLTHTLQVVSSATIFVVYNVFFCDALWRIQTNTKEGMNWI